MQLVTDLALPYLPAEQPAFNEDPMPFLEAARREHPWLARFRDGYVVHGYQANKDLFMMDDKLRTGIGGLVEFYGAQGTPWAKFMEEMLMAQGGPGHARIRTSVMGAFTPRSAKQARPVARQVISDLLDLWAPSGAFDFADFASYYPVGVLCALMGTSPDEIPAIRDALETQASSVSLNRDLLPELLAGHDILWNFADKIVREREASGLAGDTMLDAIIGARDAGKMDDTELRFMLMMLFPAGYDTSKNLLTMTMHMMLDHPEKWARCAEDLSYCTKVADEMLRHSNVATPYRFVVEDVDYDGIRFPKGTMLCMATPLSGRDPAAFSEPMVFDPDRDQANRNLAFGRGAHMCLGQHLARVQIEEGLHAIAQRITRPRLAGKVTWRPFLGIWGPASLPIAFDPGAAPATSGL